MNGITENELKTKGVQLKPESVFSFDQNRCSTSPEYARKWCEKYTSVDCDEIVPGGRWCKINRNSESV